MVRFHILSECGRNRQSPITVSVPLPLPCCLLRLMNSARTLACHYLSISVKQSILLRSLRRSHRVRNIAVPPISVPPSVFLPTSLTLTATH